MLARLRRALIGAVRRLLTSGVGLLVGGTSLGHLIYFASSPLLTRLFTPEDFGLLAVFVSGLGIPAVLIALRYEMAIMLPEDDDEAVSLLALCLLIVVSFGTAVGVLTLLAGGTLTRWVNAQALEPYLWLFAPTLVGLGAYQALSYYGIRKRAFAQISYTRLSQSILQVVIQIGTGLVGLRPLGLLIGESVGRVAGFAALAGLVLRDDLERLRRVTPASLRRCAARYARFPLLGGTAVLFNSLGLELRTLMLASFHGPGFAGWYALSQRLLSVPLDVINRAVAQVYYEEFSRALRTDPSRLVPLFLRYTGLVLVFALPYTLLLGALGPWLVPWVFGARWYAAGLYVRYYALAYLIQSIAIPTGATLDALERQDMQLVREASRVAIIVGAGAAIWSWGLGPGASVLLLAAAECVFYAWYLTINFSVLLWYTRRRAGTTPA